MTDLDDQNIVSINISHDYNAPPYDEASGFDSDVQTLAEGSYSYDVKLGNPAVPELAESAAGSSEESSTCRDLSDEDHDVEFSLQENRVGSPLNLDIQTTAMVDKELGNLTEPPVMTMQLPLGIVKNQKTGITSRPALGEPVLFETSRKGSFKHTYDKWWTCWALIIVLIVSTIVGVYMFAFDTSNETLTGATNSNSQQGITGSVRVPATVVPAATSNSATMFNSTTLTTAPKTRAPTKAPTTSTPSLAPSSSPSTLESLRIEAIIRAASREPHLLDTSSSWQALSVDWMQTEDQIETVSAGKLIQRYALVLLDLALHNSSKPKFALAKSDECFWWGVICNMNETESRQYNPVVSLTWARDGLIGQIPQDVALLTNLTKLDLAENHITGQIPAGLYNLTVLKHLYLFDNKMEGTISTMIGNMKALTRVMLGDNNFHGEIPTEIGSSNSTLNGPKPLEWLSLYNNNLTGYIPEKLALPNLVYLDLGRNNLSGSIPNNWGKPPTEMARLQSVYLDFNRLSGSLPKDWIRLGSGNLQQIILNDNLLTGEVPGRSKTRQSLKAIQLQHNSFRKIGKELCGLSIFAGGALAVLQADCGVCECDYFCNSSRCVG